MRIWENERAELESGRAGEWESGRMGERELEGGRVGARENGRVAILPFLIPALPLSHSSSFPLSHKAEYNTTRPEKILMDL